MKTYLILILFSLFLIIGCKDKQEIKPIGEFDVSNAKVKIITFVPHEVLDAVVKSSLNSLVNNYNLSKNNIEVFNPNGNLDEIRAYVRTLNAKNTDLIISVSTPATQAVLSARHPSIPLVFSFVSDTAALNLSKYENVTGISNVLNYEKGFDLLKSILPQIKKICVVYNPSEPNSYYSYKQIVLNAKNQSPPIEVISRQFTKDNEIPVVASTVSNVDAFYVGGDNKLVKSLNLLLNVADNKNIPVFASDEGSVKAGAIAAYSINYNDFGNETAKLSLEVLNKKSSTGIKMIMYKEGKNVINVTSLNKLKIDYSHLKNYSEIK